ncbi:fungal pheromone mating factor STE2 GPCR-domain-containing protein [Bisporella sp. PMI_857]|nr:fungal pheromone mating factor STE2 GPCR-domain-containing protein [Bisporella sp. PMI_857]
MASPENTTFYPYTQDITILMADGVTPVTVSLYDIDASNWYNCALIMNHGSQLGACIVMFFVVFLLTDRKKRTKPIFILNILSLLFGALRAMFLGLYFLTQWVDIYPSFTGDYSAIPTKAYATSVVATIWPFFMTITINLSLVFQAHTVCLGMSNMYYRHIIIGLGTLVVTVGIGFRFAQTITNSKAIMGAEAYYNMQWVTIGTIATQTAAVWYFSMIFTGKLIYTLYTRRRNGWKQWSGVQILAAMGGCTMVIPSIFAILEYITIDEFPEAGSLAITMVALLLPLSALWARMAIDNEAAALNFNRVTGTSGSSGSQYSDDAAYNSRKLISSQLSQSTAMSSNLDHPNERKGSVTPMMSPTTIDSRIEHGNKSGVRDSTEIDLEAMGIRVDKSYSINSAKE